MRPEHVEDMSSGGAMCKHCGGRVDADGYATGGEIPDSELEVDVEDDTPQMEAAEGMRDLAELVRKRRGG